MNTASAFLQRLLGAAAPVVNAVAAEYRIDELAQAAQTTVRNVRAYQDRGLLPPPERRGRLGIYSGEHLARLQLIGQLLERGYSIASIRELFEAWAQGRDLAHVLGREQAIRGPGEPEQPGRLEFAELQAIFGDDLDDAVIDRAQALGLLQFAGDHLAVPSPRLLAAGIELYRAGIPLPTLLDELESIRGHVEQVATGIVQIPGQPAAADLAAAYRPAGAAQRPAAAAAPAGRAGGGSGAGARPAGGRQPRAERTGASRVAGFSAAPVAVIREHGGVRPARM